MSKTKNIIYPAITIVLLAMVMSGCAPSIDGWQINQFVDACANRGGIDYISNFNGTAICVDGYIVRPKLTEG